MTNVPPEPDYQILLAEHVKKEAHIIVQAVGRITSPEQAEELVSSGKVDMVAIARAFLDDPRWPWHAAEQLGIHLEYPPQYSRCHPNAWKKQAPRIVRSNK